MASPEITWFIKQDGALVPEDEFYAGSYTPNDTMSVPIQVWNNRWGQTDVDAATTPKLSISFATYEDYALLNLMSATVDGQKAPITISGVKGYIQLKTLYGTANNGSADMQSNYCDIVLTMGPVTANLQNGLKNMFINLEFDSVDQ
jgi:hypothetical protein